MTTVETPKDAAPATADRRPPGGTVVAVELGIDRDRHPAARHGGRARWRSGSGSTSSSGGDFLTARNLWNLSVQSTSIAIMATGMVLHHRVAEHRSVGRVDARLPRLRDGDRPDRRHVRVPGVTSTSGPADQSVHLDRRARRSGSLLGRGRGLGPGLPRRVRRRPCVHRHARRLPGLARRHLPHGASRARRSRRSTRRSSVLGGGAEGLARRLEELAARPSSACAGDRPEHRPRPAATERYELDVRPMWIEVTLGIVGCGVVLARGRVSCAEQLRTSPITRRPDRHRLPGRDPDRRHAADELPGAPPPLRSLRVRLRRQPRGRRARRHQHPPHRHVHVHADGRAVSR